MSEALYVDVSWLLDVQEAALGTEDVSVTDYSALVAAVARHRTRMPTLETSNPDAAWRAAALLHTIARLSKAYTYCVSRAGTTGVHAEARFDPALVGRVRDSGAPPPVLGFGIARPEHVTEALRAGAAGVISGSAIVALAGAAQPVEGIIAFISAMKRATISP